jgi:hypothetical protein
LFQLSTRAGLGTGHTQQELKDPEVNIGIIVNKAKTLPAFAAATSLYEAVDVFVRQIAHPANPSGEVIKRLQIAQRLFRS